MKQKPIIKAVSMALIAMTIIPAHAANYSGVTVNASGAGGFNGTNTFTNSVANADIQNSFAGSSNNTFNGTSTINLLHENAISSSATLTLTQDSIMDILAENGMQAGTINALDNSVINVKASNGITNGLLLMFVNSKLNLEAENAVIDGAFNLGLDAHVTASHQNSLAGGNWSFGQTSGLTLDNYSMSGGDIVMNDNSTVTVTGFNAIQGGDITLTGNATMLAQGHYGIIGGTIYFNGNSNMVVSANTGIGGGDQNFYDNSTLEVITGDAIRGGTQTFYNNSTLSVTNGSFTGGTQVFMDNARLTFASNRAYNIQGAVVNLQGNNTIMDLNQNTTVVLSHLEGFGTVQSTSGSGFSRLILDDYGIAAFNGSIVDDFGAMEFRKTGPGTFALNGLIDTAAAVAIDGGTMLVNGRIYSQDTYVNAGGTIGGWGEVENLSIRNGATLSPGQSVGNSVNSIDTLQVNRNLDFSPGSTYIVEIDDHGHADRINVTGTATLAGTVNVRGLAGNFVAGDTYNILSAMQGYSGTFDQTTTDLAFLKPELSYLGNDVFVTLVKNGVTYSDVGLLGGRNQRAAAFGLGGIQALAVNNAIQGLTTQGALNAYSQLGGEIHAATQAGLIEDTDFLRSGVIDRLANHDGKEAWIKVTNTNAYTGATSETDNVTRRANAALIGLDRKVGDDGAWTVGFAGGYGNTNASTMGSTSKVDTVHAGAYLGRSFGDVTFKVGAGYAFNDVDSDRKLNFGSYQSKAKGDYKAHSLQAFADVGYKISTGNGYVEPFVNVAGVQVTRESFKESNSEAGLNVKSNSSFTTFTTAGVRVNQPVFQLKGFDVSLVGSLGYRNAGGDVTQESRQSLAGGQAFDTQGNPIARNAVVFDLGLKGSISSTLEAGIGYRGQAGDNVRSHATSVYLNWQF